jgi:sugar phosphate permease
LILGVHTGCNATHSILGTAAAMDLGGRKMAGFAAGVIDSFQYFGAMLAGFGLGYMLDHYKNTAQEAADAVAAASGQAAITVVEFNPTVWFASMLPWAVLGTALMVYLWVAHRNKSTPGT